MWRRWRGRCEFSIRHWRCDIVTDLTIDMVSLYEAPSDPRAGCQTQRLRGRWRWKDEPANLRIWRLLYCAPVRSGMLDPSINNAALVSVRTYATGFSQRRSDLRQRARGDAKSVERLFESRSSFTFDKRLAKSTVPPSKTESHACLGVQQAPFPAQCKLGA